MDKITGKGIITRIDRHLYDPRLDSEELLRKRWSWIWMLVTMCGVLFTTITSLFIFNLWPLLWSAAAFFACYLVGFLLYPRIKRFDLVLNIMFSIFIIIIFFVLIQAGGLGSSLGFVFVGLNCAMGSMLVGKMRWTIGMFILYVTTIALTGILQPNLETPSYITPQINTWSFVMSSAWISACTLLLILFFFRDHRRFQKAEAERLKMMDEAKTLLYTNVSHEFRTPLTVIRGMADQLEKNPERWINSGPGKIKIQSEILLHLVNQMLDISKLEAEGMHLNMIQGDISRYVTYIASSFQSLADNSDIELKIESPSSPLIADYDPEKLMHVLSNLISNAIKFTPHGGSVMVSVYEGLEANKESVNLVVRDTGRGIPGESLDHIFDRFYRAADKYDQTPGTGLGLALTRQLVQLMKGDIVVKSEVGKGSEFIVTLPVTHQARIEKDDGVAQFKPGIMYPLVTDRLKDKHLEKHSSQYAGEDMLLIVEDNHDVVEYLVSILQDHYLIEHAENGRQGYERAIEIIPDLILTDVMMPEMDGFEMLSKLRGDVKTDHIPVVILTARGDFESKITGLDIGADHYLVKPFSEKELLLKLNNLLEARIRMQKKLGVLPAANPTTNDQYKKELQFMTRINSVLEERSGEEDFGVKDLCSALNMSRPQLYRKFSALTDRPLGKYIRSYRLHKAKIMIESQGKNITEAAMDSGFKNLSHFSASFKEEFGYPPSELMS